MRRKSLLFGLAALGIFAALFYFYDGQQTPGGQRPLAALDSRSLGGLRNQFNTSHSQVRLLVLLSPT